ncbi:ATP synthase F0 subunit B [Actinotalea subterranea]|uniref:ATP synthase F0 subunit B n=1 Tax=Actinotalea subterranea TaxID=2607497 RepID=UPI0011EF58E7|nr:ATP synthase F0 subunit B [Actinotalea subterranea]
MTAPDGTQHDDRRDPEGLTGILEALEHAVSQARAMPMSSSVLVNRAELLDLLDQAFAVLPTQLTEADEVLAGADEVLADARARAEQVIAAARARADELVATEQVVVAARVRADEIVAEAERTAVALRRDADDYCDRQLADFEIDLGKVLAQVQAGRAKLADRLDLEP